jgi:hypothetical protein
MSTNAVSSVSILQELQSFYQNRQADLKQLGSALQSGDLAGAQQAYKALAVLGENGPFANSEPFAKSSRAQAFDAIGKALQAGDLARAQAGFATLTARHTTSPPTTPAAIVNLAGAQHDIEPLTANNATSIYQQLQAYRQQRQADLAQLGQALQSGDLAGAQSAFVTLTALGQSGPNQGGATFSRADRNQDFQAIGQALQSGDFAGAQSAFASLSSTFGKQSQQAQTAISAYNSVAAEIVINFGRASSSSASSSAAPQEVIVNIGQGTGSSSGASNVPEVVINLGGASSTNTSSGSIAPELVINLGQGTGTSSASSEEVQINLGKGSSGAQITIDATQGTNGNTDQVTISLNQQKTSNYELILNLLAATSQIQNSSSNALSVSA